MSTEINEKCSMCFFTSVSKLNVIKHIVWYHRFDLSFMVKCTQHGCGATYQNWKSFNNHLYRKHSTILRAEGNITADNIENTNDIETEEEIHDASLNEDEPLRFNHSIESLQWHAAKFFINIRENCKVSQNAMNKKEMREAADSQTQMLTVQCIEDIFIEKYPSSMIFSHLTTEDDLEKFLVEEMDLVLPREKKLSTNFVWRKKRGPRGETTMKICKADNNAYVVPFLENLKNVLMNDEIRANVDNPLQYINGTYRTVLDGSYYRENEFFSQNPNSLAIILYYDDLEIANVSGSSAKFKKLSMFYWVLANIRPELRSLKNAIQLLAIVKTKHIKNPDNLRKILQFFVDDIVKLQMVGIDIVINNTVKNYKGSLLFFAGDTPASALIGGFKESVSATRPCRSCMVAHEDLKRFFTKEDFILRNLDNHEDHLNAINEPNSSKGASDFWKKTYGINRRSSLMNIPHFDITAGLPQDCMHVLIEGVTEITCRLFLCHIIMNEKLCLLNNINNNISTFNYGHLGSSQPAIIHKDELAIDKSLRQSAAQMFALAHTLPFLIDEWVYFCEREGLRKRLEHYILLLQIMNLCLSYEISADSVNLLSQSIELFLSQLILLYPDHFVPKFHFLIHVPRYIKLFGPARQQWCFRFESAHAYFKSLVPVVRNFKNMPYTLSYRHQVRLCSHLNSYPKYSSKIFLYKGDEITPGPTVRLQNLSYANLLYEYVGELERNVCQVMRSPKIIIHDTVYQNQSIILLECDENFLPVF
ncbi:uncharacterized protein, partial [Chelonus insularis]|uniref:uncharacterized protein n=1 Tax=Chelonus insularis TaxID=460826 RepID=UPI00158F0AC3